MRTCKGEAFESCVAPESLDKHFPPLVGDLTAACTHTTAFQPLQSSWARRHMALQN